MITRLRYGLATNSSSSHSMVTLPPGVTLPELGVDLTYPVFDNDYRLTTETSKRHFLAANLRDQAPELWGRDVLLDPDTFPEDTEWETLRTDGTNTRPLDARWDSRPPVKDQWGCYPGVISLPEWLTEEINRLAGLPLSTDLSHHSAENSFGIPFEIPRARGGIGPDPVAWEAEKSPSTRSSWMCCGSSGSGASPPTSPPVARKPWRRGGRSCSTSSGPLPSAAAAPPSCAASTGRCGGCRPNGSMSTSCWAPCGKRRTWTCCKKPTGWGTASPCWATRPPGAGASTRPSPTPGGCGASKRREPWAPLSIDTALAAEYAQDLLAAGVAPRLFHTREGQYSAFIDAVHMTLSRSSYGDQSYPLRENWLTEIWPLL